MGVQNSTPILAMLDALRDLVLLAEWSRGTKSDPISIRTTKARRPSTKLKPMIRAASIALRDNLMASLEIELAGPGKLHNSRGGPIGPIIKVHRPWPYRCYSDEATELSVDEYNKLCDLVGGSDDDLEGTLDEDEVVSEWEAVVGAWRPSGITAEAVDRLKDLIVEEHENAPEIPVIFPTVFESAFDPDLAAKEALARNEGPTIETTPPSENETVDELFWVPVEPFERSATKVAGLPYRPSGLPWPMTEAGKPFIFFAQFCFADSRELFDRELPGDVLLIFVSDSEFYLGSPFGVPRILYEWHSTGQGSLIEASEIPAPEWKLHPFCRIRHRTSEEELTGNYPGLSRIGGEPTWIQNDDAHDDCLFLGSIGPLHRAPEAWVEAGNLEPKGDGEVLSMQDALKTPEG